MLASLFETDNIIVMLASLYIIGVFFFIYPRPDVHVYLITLLCQNVRGLIFNLISIDELLAIWWLILADDWVTHYPKEQGKTQPILLDLKTKHMLLTLSICLQLESVIVENTNRSYAIVQTQEIYLNIPWWPFLAEEDVQITRQTLLRYTIIRAQNRNTAV